MTLQQSNNRNLVFPLIWEAGSGRNLEFLVILEHGSGRNLAFPLILEQGSGRNILFLIVFNRIQAKVIGLRDCCLALNKTITQTRSKMRMTAIAIKKIQGRTYIADPAVTSKICLRQNVKRIRRQRKALKGLIRPLRAAVYGP